MIVFEEKLAEVLNTIPPLEKDSISYPIYFNWGTEEVLTKYLAITQQSHYPLIWLVNGIDSYDRRNVEVTRDRMKVIIAIKKADVDLFNPDWWQTDYKLVLNVVAENVVNAITKASNAYSSDNYSLQRFPNYTQNNSEGVSVDVWNAITIEFDSVTFNNNCLKPIKYG